MPTTMFHAFIARPRRARALLVLLCASLFAGLAGTVPATFWPVGGLAPRPALAAQAGDAAAPAPDAPEGQYSMDLIWQTRGQELSALVEETDRLRKTLPDMAKTLDTQVASIQRDYQRLFALYQLSRNHPSEMAAIRRQISTVQRSLQGRLATMETMDATVRQRLDDFTA